MTLDELYEIRNGWGDSSAFFAWFFSMLQMIQYCSSRGFWNPPIYTVNFNNLTLHGFERYFLQLLQRLLHAVANAFASAGNFPLNAFGF